MKRILALLLAALLPFNLCGCGSSLYKHRDVQQLLIIQTLGLDSANGGVTVSLASSATASSGSAARQLSADGDTISSAMERINNNSFEDELFLYHVDHVLLGESAAEDGINGFLGYICRSPSMLIESPIFVVRESSAEEALFSVGDESNSIVEIMENVAQKLKKHSAGRETNITTVIQELMRCGSTLICAVSCSDAHETQGKSYADKDAEAEEKSGKTIAIAGYAIIRDGKLCRYIEAEDSIAVDFLKNEVGVCDVEIKDKLGQRVALEVFSGGSDIRPVWSAPGVLSALNVDVTVKASVLEIRGKGHLDQGEYTDHLTAQLEALLSQRISSVLQSSKELRADFLCLADDLRQADPNNFRLMTLPLPDTLATLAFNISVSAELSHSNDMKGE